MNNSAPVVSRERALPVESAVDAEFLSSSREVRITPRRLAAAMRQPVAVALVWLMVAVSFFNIWHSFPGHAQRWDFSIYYLSATMLNEGRNPYTSDFGPLAHRLGLEAGPINHATDPPTFLLTMAPLGRMPEQAAYATWMALTVIFLVLSVVLLLRGAGLEMRGVLAGAGLMVLYPPVVWHFAAAQSKIEILLLLVLMMRLMENGHERTAGICLGAAGLLRIFPLLLVGYLILQRRWRCIIWTLIALAAGGLATVWKVGWQTSLSFRSGIELFTSPHWLAFPANVAVGPAVSRFFWFVWGSDLPQNIDRLRLITIIAIDTLVLAITARATLRVLPGGDQEWRAFTLWIITSVLLTPTALVFYLVLFLLPFPQIVAAAAHDGINGSLKGASERTQWAAILSYVLMMIATVLLGPTREVALHHAANRWIQWSMGILGEGWFASAMLMYLAAYWFVSDMPVAPSSHGPAERTAVFDHPGQASEV